MSINYLKDEDEIHHISHLLKHAGKYPVLKKDAEAALVARAQGTDAKDKFLAKTTLLNHNFRIIIKIAKKFSGQGVPLEDLVQEGCDGFLHAVDLFDLSRGFKLSTYAHRWIEQRVRRAIENKSKMAKIPSNKLADICQLKKAYKAFVEEENRPPTSRELGDILGIGYEKAEQLGRLTYDHVSLDSESEEEESLPLINYLMDEKPAPEINTEQGADREYINNLLYCLSKEDQDFIRLRFGFLDDRERTPKEMAALLRISLKEAKSREEFILKRLRESSNIEDINIPMECDLILVKYKTKNIDQLIDFILKTTNLSKREAFEAIRQPPGRLYYKISQHLAEEYSEQLYHIGAVTSLHPSV